MNETEKTFSFKKKNLFATARVILADHGHVLRCPSNTDMLPPNNGRASSCRQTKFRLVAC